MHIHVALPFIAVVSLHRHMSRGLGFFILHNEASNTYFFDYCKIKCDTINDT